jgi:uncharacterized C2H2 Zn-finger protein
VYKPNSDSERESDSSPCEGLKEIGYNKRMYRMAFSRQDEEEDIRNTRRGIEMPKFLQRAPKGSKVPEARFSSEDEDSSNASLIPGTTEEDEEKGYSAKKKKQQPANLWKSDKSSKKDEKAKMPPKKQSNTSATLQNVDAESEGPSQKATKKKVARKRPRHSDASSGEEGEGTIQVPKVPTCPKCEKTFENKNNVRRHLVKVHGLNKNSEQLKKLMSEMVVNTRAE